MAVANVGSLIVVARRQGEKTRTRRGKWKGESKGEAIDGKRGDWFAGKLLL